MCSVISPEEEERFRELTNNQHRLRGYGLSRTDECNREFTAADSQMCFKKLFFSEYPSSLFVYLGNTVSWKLMINGITFMFVSLWWDHLSAFIGTFPLLYKPNIQNNAPIYRMFNFSPSTLIYINISHVHLFHIFSHTPYFWKQNFIHRKPLKQLFPPFRLPLFSLSIPLFLLPVLHSFNFSFISVLQHQPL